MSLTLTLWTNDFQLAAWADGAGVDRIGLDLENLEKANRQKGLPTWLSPHKMEDLATIIPAICRSRLFVRTNPLHPGSQAEIDSLLAQGVKVLMLPNFTTLDEVARYLEMVAGRAEVVPLVERLLAVKLIPLFPQLGVREFHVGLNDLSIDLSYTDRMEVLVSSTVEQIANEARRAGLRFGLGGLGRAQDKMLPIPSELVYAQHAWLGSQGALIARSFFYEKLTEEQFSTEIRKLRERFEYWCNASQESLEKMHQELIARFTDSSATGR